MEKKEKELTGKELEDLSKPKKGDVGKSTSKVSVREAIEVLENEIGIDFRDLLITAQKGADDSIERMLDLLQRKFDDDRRGSYSSDDYDTPFVQNVSSNRVNVPDVVNESTGRSLIFEPGEVRNLTTEYIPSVVNRSVGLKRMIELGYLKSITSMAAPVDVKVKLPFSKQLRAEGRIPEGGLKGAKTIKISDKKENPWFAAQWAIREKFEAMLAAAGGRPEYSAEVIELRERIDKLEAIARKMGEAGVDPAGER